MIREDKYIRFDWAMKRLLRNKANFAVLEGLLTTLLGEKITIRRLLESESNQEEKTRMAGCFLLKSRTTTNMPTSSVCCSGPRSW